MHASQVLMSSSLFEHMGLGAQAIAVEGALALHAASPGSIPSILCGPRACPASLGVAPEEMKTQYNGVSQDHL